MSKPKLELTWVGKDQRPRLEPRILLADPAKSYHAAAKVTEHDIFDNKLIFGDNLLALKALEREYAGEVKCIYIDPPFNTGEMFEYYDDGLEHSIWLSQMRDRLEILYNLLADDGTIFVHLDDNEVAYMIVLMDQVFGRGNRVSIVTFKQGAATGHKAINKGVVSTSNFLIVFAKDKLKWNPSKIYTAREERDKRYGGFIENINEPYENWRFTTLTKAFAQSMGLPEKGIKKILGDDFETKLSGFVLENAESIIQLARPDYNSVSNAAREKIDKSRNDPQKIFKLCRDGLSDMYFIGGQRILFYSGKLKFIDGKYVAGEPLTSIWDDLLSNNLHKEGGVTFPKGKKPEALIKRCLELATNEGDLVLDSFAGSGTTGAVAHKMRRRWIMVELGEHCHTHIIPRLQKVIDGTDQAGVTEATGWNGGGGFQYYKLAPSLMEQDQWGNWIINREYNKEMLCEALCKIEGYRYAPSDTQYWQHGQGSETDFIYVTTQTLSDAQLNALSEAVGEGRSLLIIASAWRCPNLDKYPNLTLKKIPNSIAKACEWGRDDYSLNVENLPMSQPTAQAKTRSNSSGNDSPNKTKAKAKPIDQYMDDMFEGDA
jgi:adenine-specific DNA-methyltransferase